MHRKSMFWTGFTAAVLVAVSTAPPAAARGLSGGFRASFMKIYVAGCLKSSAEDSDISKLPRATQVSFCRCSGAYIAARATPAQFDNPNAPEMLAIEAGAARVCMPR